jgi:hypothetical protein
MCFPEEVGSVSTPTALHDNVYNNSAIGWRNISSAVSTVLRSQEFPFADAAGAEHCGYGDLR